MEYRERRLAAAFVLATVTLATTSVQTHAQQATELPGIIIEGATLAQPRRAPRPTTAEPATVSAPIATAPTVAPPPASAGVFPADGAPVEGVPATELGTAVTVVTGEQLRAQQITHAADALRGLPGVMVTRNSTPGSVTEVRLRGAENNHTLVLIDGVVANDPTSGAFDFADLSTADIERIEVIRGAHSVIYGSGAVGGVINVITRGGRGPARVDVSTEFGSFGTRDLSLGLSGGSERAWGALRYHVRESNGFNIAPQGKEDDASRLETFALRGGVTLAPGLIVDGSLRYSRKAGERDGFGGPPNTLATALDDPSRFTGDVLLGSVRARWETFGGALTHELRTAYNFTRTTDTDLSFPAFPFLSKFEAETRTHAYLATIRLPSSHDAFLRHTIAGLVEWQEESFTPLGDFTDGLTRTRDRFAFAGEWRGTLARQFDITAGVRHDDNSTFEDFTSWRTSASWTIPGTGLRPHASVGTGFKAPSFFEQFGSIPAFFIANPDLLPETSFGWDAGVELALMNRRLVFDVTYFNAELEDKIARNPAGFAPTLVNLPGTSTREGVELSGRFIIVPGVTLGASYTYTDARDPDGAREVRRPPHSARVDLDTRHMDGRLRFNFAAVYNGRQNDLAFRTGPGPFDPWTTELFTLDSYWKLTAAAAYKLQPSMEIFARVENLLDANYQEIYGYAQPGIAAYAGMRITFGGESDRLK